MAGYASFMRQHGYRPQSAVPWDASDVEKVMSHLAAQGALSHGVDRVLLARDLFCLSAQWTFLSRGVTAVEWRIEDITLQDGVFPPEVFS